MKVRIIETGEVTEIKLIDPNSGIDEIMEFVGNADAFGMGEGKFYHEAGSDEYVIDRGTFDWWAEYASNWICDEEEWNKLHDELYDTLSPDAADKAVDEFHSIRDCGIDPDYEHEFHNECIQVIRAKYL